MKVVRNRFCFEVVASLRVSDKTMRSGEYSSNTLRKSVDQQVNCNKLLSYKVCNAAGSGTQTETVKSSKHPTISYIGERRPWGRETGGTCEIDLGAIQLYRYREQEKTTPGVPEIHSEDGYDRGENDRKRKTLRIL